MIPGKVQVNKPATNTQKTGNGFLGSALLGKKTSDDPYAHLPKSVADTLRKQGVSADAVKKTDHGYTWEVTSWESGADSISGQGRKDSKYYTYDSRLGDKVWHTGGSQMGLLNTIGSQAYKDAVEKYETEQEYARQKAEAEAERAKQQAIIDAEQRKATALSNQRNALDSIARSDEQGAVVSKPSTVTGDLSGVSVDGEEAGKRRRGRSLTRLLGI